MGTEVAEQRIRKDVVEHFNREVSPAKRLMKVSVVFEELPRTRLGKLRRFALPDLARESTRHMAEPALHFEKTPTYKALSDFLEKTKGITIEPTDHVEMDLGLDSLDRVSLLYFIKQTFGVEVDEAVLSDCPTVGKLADFIKEHKSRLDIRAINWRDILRERTELQLPKGIFSLILIQRLGGLVLRGMFRVTGKGMERLPPGPIILAPNHQSYLDGLFVAMFLTSRQMGQTYFYAKKKHVNNAFLRFMARTHHVIVVDMDRDLKESIQKLAEVLRQGDNVIIFPEGTRTRDGSLGEYKKTVAILSRELDVPVVPVVIDGAFKALPRGKHKVRCGTRISVEFLEPVPPGDADYDTLLNTYKQRQARVLAALSCRHNSHTR
jgi:long-chain acyl-CoA synthetase